MDFLFKMSGPNMKMGSCFEGKVTTLQLGKLHFVHKEGTNILRKTTPVYHPRWAPVNRPVAVDDLRELRQSVSDVMRCGAL